MKARGALLVLGLVACGESDRPALVVGPISYSSEQLLGLSEARRMSLANLTALGLAVADSTVAELGAPLVGRWEDDLLIDLLAAELTLEKNDVGDDVLEARYRTNPEFELTVRHILFFTERWRTDDERAEARRKAERALESIRAGADFAETAARLSEEPGAEGREGLLTPGREGAWVDEFWAAASALDEGGISPVTETEYGYHILRLEARDTVPFAEARNRVALEVADRIEDPRAVLDTWLNERAQAVDVPPEVPTATPEDLGAETLLATWRREDGEERRLTYEQYATSAAAEPTSWNRGGLGTDPETFERSIRALARRHIALDEAERRGLSVDEAERARLERRWEDQVYQWSVTLGFRGGMSAQTVENAALAALSRTGQGADLARRAVDQRAPLLAAKYQVPLPEPSG